MRVAVRVRPGSSRDRAGGAYGESSSPQLVVAVTARAVGGAATEAVLRVVAQAFGVRRRDIRLVQGATARTKVLDIDGPEEELSLVLQRLLRGG